MGVPQALPRLLTRSLQRMFGGAEVHRQAFDMMARLERAYPASWTIISLSFVPGLVYYNAWPVIPLACSGIAYFLALTAPPKSRYPELVAASSWTVGLMCSMYAASLAGPPYAFMWVGVAISLPFIAVIWPWRVVLGSVVMMFVVLAIGAITLIPGDEIKVDPPALLGPLIGLIMCVVMISMVREVDRRNRQAVLTDVLTGLGNRAAMEVYLRDVLLDGASRNASIAMVVFDLDHFKALNDDLGHAQGDAALRSTAEALRARLPAGGGLFRYGGEEFVVLLPATEQAAALAVAEEMRAGVAALSIGGHALTVSGGLVVDRMHTGLDLGAMFQRADAALYDAKNQGRNRVLVGLPQVGRTRTRPIAGATVVSGDRSRRSIRMVRTRLERDHLRAMWTALRGPGVTRGMNMGLVAGGLLGIPWLGPVPALLAITAAVVLDPSVRRQRSLPIATRGSELGLMWESLFGMTLVGFAISLAKEDALYLLPFIAIPAFPSMVAYRSLGAIIVGVIGSVIVLATGFIAAPDLVIENPLIVSLPMGFLGVLTVVGMALVSSTMEHAAAANIDPLTGALNRGALEARVAEFALADAASYEPVTLIVADLDHFKAINDTYGHDAGDEVLVDVARRLQQELRLVDVLYRVGGEEFVVLLPRTNGTEARQIAERLREVISERPCGGRPLTVSLGLASSDEPGFDYAPAFDRADAALLQAKVHGRNQVVVAV